MTNAAIHRVSIHADELSLRLLVHNGSPRVFNPRDDKMWGNGSVRFGYNTIFVIARRTEWTTRQSIVSRGRRTGLSIHFLAPQRIDTGYSLAMTRCVEHSKHPWRRLSKCYTLLISSTGSSHNGVLRSQIIFRRRRTKTRFNFEFPEESPFLQSFTRSRHESRCCCCDCSGCCCCGWPNAGSCLYCSKTRPE